MLKILKYIKGYNPQKKRRISSIPDPESKNENQSAIHPKKIYNSSGIEVKKPIMRICPTCGYFPCGGFNHCLRCGQPLFLEDYDSHYVERYKNLEEEIAFLETLSAKEKESLGIDERNTISPKERREQILKGINVMEYDIDALYKGKLVRLYSDGKRVLEYEGINLSDYDVE